LLGLRTLMSYYSDKVYYIFYSTNDIYILFAINISVFGACRSIRCLLSLIVLRRPYPDSNLRTTDTYSSPPFYNHPNGDISGG
jgi:hypothetical protein